MKYTKFGRTGMFVSVLALGAMTFGETNSWKIGGLSQEQVNEMVKRAYDYGINLYDTADVYDNGQSEIALGKAVRSIRDEIHIATKVRGRMGKGINQQGLSRSHIEKSIKGSLQRLGTDFVDIYQAHSYDFDTPVEETIEAFQNLVENGQIHYPALSNFSSWQMAIFNTVAKERHYEMYQSAQLNYSILNRDIENQEIPYIRHEGMSLMAWSPLQGGVLTGKYGKNIELKSGTRFGDRGMIFPYFDQEKAPSILSVIEEIAREQGCKMTAISLAWLIEKRSIVIIGARNLEQFEENMSALDVSLTKEQVERIDKISSQREMYPNWMFKRTSGPKNFQVIE